MSVLRNSCVVLAGVGNVGARVASLLAQLGIGLMKLLDPDIVEPINCGQGYTRGQIGKPKVHALAHKLRGMRSDLEIECVQERFDPRHYFAIREAQHVAGLGMFFDDFPVLASQLRILYPSTPLVHAHMRNGGTGVIAASVPRHTSCIPCSTGLERLRQGHGRDGDPLAMSLVAIVATKVILALALRNSPEAGRYARYLKEPLCHALVMSDNRSGVRHGRSDIPLWCQFVRPDWTHLPSCAVCRSYLSNVKGNKT